MRRALFIANLALLILFPMSWAAPLARAGVLPFFGLSEISVLSGIRSLWSSDPLLAGVVALFALVAPLAKTLTLAAVLSHKAHPRWLRLTGFLGRLAMADVFLIALYIVLSKGIGIGRVETAWGLYLFTTCVLASLAISALAKRR
ncbi:paraquat-inducible protein A [Pseudooceanicola spongiae]|uniref:Paraquat-inducible membrane protein A n=1 Tax=Pseudooceanicola spongiae TaxID=2613965 RepID=A0A7L9WJN1_9RHOB|nr:paraquat-inducible protein A [Pseudooceanicola spongiae]QOL80601.1 paraquat-inducible membrane protein A [Pseudooceanicola spongiae]